MHCSRDRLDQETMGASCETKHDFHRLVVCCKHLFCFRTKQIPQNWARKTSIPDWINKEFSPRMCEVKFLTNFVVFTDIPCSFLFDILSCDVPVSHDLVTDVFARVLPRQEITAELHSTSYFFFLNKESKSTCFTQPRVGRMSAELEIDTTWYWDSSTSKKTEI